MAEEIEEVEEKPKRGKKALIIPLVVLLAGLGGGGYFFMTGSKPKASATAPHTPTTVALGSIVRLDPITLNLNDGHVLKVGMALQTVAKPQHKHLATALAAAGANKPSAGGTSSPLEGEEAKALDEAIRVLGDSSFDELSKPGGRAHAKDVLSEQIKHIYEGDIVGVYFTDFVMS